MPKPTKGPRLGGGPAHERLLLANLAAALFTHKSIKTTETKAKRLRPVAERLITFAKRGDLHARRRVLGVIGDKGVVHELFTQIAPLVAEREGGYTRITKLGFRKGDNASMVQMELVLEPVTPKRRAKSSTASAAATAPVDDIVVDDVVDDVDDTVVDDVNDAVVDDVVDDTAASAPVADDTTAATPVADETAAAAPVEDVVVAQDVVVDDTVVDDTVDDVVDDTVVAAPSPDAAPAVAPAATDTATDK